MWLIELSPLVFGGTLLWFGRRSILRRFPKRAARPARTPRRIKNPELRRAVAAIRATTAAGKDTAIEEHVNWKQGRRVEERQAWRNEWERLEPPTVSQRDLERELARNPYNGKEARMAHERIVRERFERGRLEAHEKEIKRLLKEKAAKGKITPVEDLPSPKPPKGGGGVTIPRKGREVTIIDAEGNVIAQWTP